MLWPRSHLVNGSVSVERASGVCYAHATQETLMRRVHDVGGTRGFGPLEIEENEPVFHEEWEGRVFGMMTTVGHRAFPMRPTIESIEPATYLASSYYEKWLIALEKGFVQSGSLTAHELRDCVELRRRNPDAPVSQNHDSTLTRSAWRDRYSQRSPRYDGDPAFSTSAMRFVSRHIDPDRTHPHSSIRSGKTRRSPRFTRRLRPARSQSTGHPQAGTGLHRRFRRP